MPDDELLDAANESHKMHSRIEQVIGRKQNTNITTYIEDRDGNIVMERENGLDI